MEHSYVQTINGRPLRFYPMGGKRPNPRSMEHLVPYMVATTYAVLCLLLLQLGRKTWPYYAADLATSLACATLHRFKQPLLSFNLAIGYTIWNLIPGSLAAKDLPSHSEFMQSLKIKEPTDTPTDCVICWESDQSTAELPCGHKFCLPCIKLMTSGEKFQTTCPTCRQPLFNVAERFQIAGMKGNYTCFVLTLSRGILHFAHEFARRHYVMAAVDFAMVCGMLAVPAYISYRVWTMGHLGAWWTNKPVAKSWSDLYTTGAVFAMSVVMICANFWSDFDRFG
jgi:hypothetical protein